MKARRWPYGIVLALMVASPAIAAEPGAPTRTLPADLPALPSLGEEMQRDSRSGLALHGYDPVAYRLEGRPAPGLAEFELNHRGAIFRFASAANRAAFQDAPETYEPSFAGFDPLAIANGQAVETDPRSFAIVGTRLYLFHSETNRQHFLERTELDQAAQANWPQVSREIAH